MAINDEVAPEDKYHRATRMFCGASASAPI
jgi:hypothetical protein